VDAQMDPCRRPSETGRPPCLRHCDPCQWMPQVGCRKSIALFSMAHNALAATLQTINMMLPHGRRPEASLLRGQCRQPGGHSIRTPRLPACEDGPACSLTPSIAPSGTRGSLASVDQAHWYTSHLVAGSGLDSAIIDALPNAHPHG
jgi:hypothetical protein